MKPTWQAMVIAGLLPLFGTTSCTMATVERNLQWGSRELARDFSQLGRSLERGLDNLFDARPVRPVSYRPSSARPKPRPAPAPVSAPQLAAESGHPFATPVPGRSGFVKLPGRDDLPEVDVRGIPSGTSIEVPDAGGGSIGFRVP